MTTTLPAFTPLEETLFLTLAGRALDQRSPHPILGDAASDEIVRRLDYDCDKFHLSSSPIINIAHRAKKLERSGVLVLRPPSGRSGRSRPRCGVGAPGVMRVNPPVTVDWFDIDFPEVVTARQTLIPQRKHAHNVAADLTEAAWLEEIPTDRPAVIVADGLMAFLSEDEMITLLDRLTRHFPSGEIAFNGYTKFAIWAAGHYRGTQSVAGLLKSPSYFDTHEAAPWIPKLTLAREILLTREPEVAQFPVALRLFTQLSSHSTAWSRKGTTVLQYRF